MNNILREMKYSFIMNIRSRGYLFWSLAFPFLLAIFYNLAFSNLLIRDFDDINVGLEKDSYLIEIFKEIDIINPIEIDNIKSIKDNEEINISVDNDLNLYVKSRGMEETIVKSVVDQIVEMKELNIPYENYDFSVKYVKNNDESANGMMISFYSLIAMFSFYAAFAGLGTAEFSSAELSYIGMRKGISSQKKIDFILPDLLSNMAINLVGNIGLLLFIEYYLKIKIISDINYSILILIIGNIFGASFGLALGSLNLKNNNLKNAIVQGVMLIASAMAGMMSPDMKLILDERLPIVNKLNPISLITDNLYRVNGLGNTTEIKTMIIIVSIYSIALLSLSYVLLRRKKYDSI